MNCESIEKRSLWQHSLFNPCTNQEVADLELFVPISEPNHICLNIHQFKCMAKDKW